MGATKTRLNQLVKAWYTLRICQKANNIRIEQKAYDKFNAILAKLQKDFPDLDWSSPEFWDQLSKAARKYGSKQCVSGPGITY